MFRALAAEHNLIGEIEYWFGLFKYWSATSQWSTNNKSKTKRLNNIAQFSLSNDFVIFQL